MEETRQKLVGMGYRLYPDIWDSAISSGQIRLLNSEQVTILAEVYRFIKGTAYEAKRVRDFVEDRRRATGTICGELTLSWKKMTISFQERKAQLREMIDGLLSQ